MSDWTDDFSKFRSKVESVFGKLEVLVEKTPDIYAHQVLSHGFMEYAGVRRIYETIKKRIQTEQGSLYGPRNLEHNKLYWIYLKEEYLAWARQNNLPEQMLEDGWREFHND